MKKDSDGRGGLAERIQFHGGEKSVVLWDRDDPRRRANFPAADENGQTSPRYLVVRYLCEKRDVNVLVWFLEDQASEVLARACKEYCEVRGVVTWQEVGDEVAGVMQRYSDWLAAYKLAAGRKGPRGAHDARFATARGRRDVEE